MLLTGLQGQPYGFVAQAVNGNADDSSRNTSLVFFPGCKVTGDRSSEAHRESESLGASDSYVSSPGSRFLQNGKGEDVAVCRNHSSGIVHLLAERAVVSYFSVCGRILYQCSEAHRVNFPVFPVAEDNLDSKAFRPCADNGLYLRENLVIYKEHVLSGLLGIAAAEVEHHPHCFSRCLAVVQH